MDLRLKLSLAFSAVALTGLALYGAVAYTGARDYLESAEARLLQEHNQRLLAELPRDRLPAAGEGAGGVRLRILEPGQDLPPELWPVREQVRRDRPSQGRARQGKTRILWAATPLGDGRLLLSLKPSGAQDPLVYLRAAAVPLGITALLTVWAAVWMGLILGTLFQRVSQQKAVLDHQARHDSLTDLPNRTALAEALTEAIAAPRPASLALCTFDLNRFKEINDSLGHDCGDELLRQVGRRLEKLLRSTDRVARLGGDEFAVILPDTTLSRVDQVAERLVAALARPFEVHGHRLYVGASFGFALYPEHARDARTLAQKAEVAMYQAKASGKEYAVYNAAEDDNSVERLALVHDLRDAITQGKLSLHYQPQVDLASGHVVGVEALARWVHPQRGFIPPDRFVALAEHTGLIKPLTDWVLETAVHQWNEWRKAGLRLYVSVNLSAWNLQDPRLIAHIQDLLRRWGMPPAALELEITETAMMADPEHALATLKRLDALGVRLSVDDFGTGYSSLAYLKRLPVDEIKIDKSFVLNMTEDEDDASIVRATVSLAHDLGLAVVAEGIENAEAMEILRRLGCERAQGYHIARPLPPEEIPRFLASRQEAPAARPLRPRPA